MCTRRYFILLLLLVLLLVSHGSLSGESFSNQLNEASTQLTEISKESNELSVSSQLTLMDLQLILPRLQQQLTELEIEWELLTKDLDLLSETSVELLAKWVILKDGIQDVSNSIEILEMSLSNLDDSVKQQRNKTNIGLGLSIVAALVGSIALGYSIFGNK